MGAKVGDRRLVKVLWRGAEQTIELVVIDDLGHELEARAAVAWKQMRLAAELDGVDLRARTAFRDRAFQTDLRKRYEAYRDYCEALEHWKKLGKPKGEEPETVPFAALAAKPGFSGHEIGKCVDVERVLSQPEVTEKIDLWLDKNANRFGWYRNVEGERWHYEYIP